MFRFLALTAALATPVVVAAEASDKSQILSVIRTLDGDVFNATWPEATLTFSDRPKSDADRTRPWREVPGNQLNFQSRIEQSQITVRADLAIAYVAMSGRWYAGLDYTGEHALIYDYHVLNRRQGTWKISSTARRVLRFRDGVPSQRSATAGR